MKNIDTSRDGICSLYSNQVVFMTLNEILLEFDKVLGKKLWETNVATIYELFVFNSYNLWHIRIISLFIYLYLKEKSNF